MKAGYKFSAIASTLSLILCLALLSVNAAAQGSITGTVKLNGTPPHMRGIDMSKDPYCVQQHTNAPVSMETVVVGSGGGVGERCSVYLRGPSSKSSQLGRHQKSRCLIKRAVCTLPTYWRWT